MTATIIALVVVGVLAVGFLLIGQQGGDGVPGRQVSSEGLGHVTQGSPIEYKNSPPSSGSHYPSPRRWGAYPEGVPEGNFVHNLEHGGVVFLYKCDEPCPDLERSMDNLYLTFPPSNFGTVKLLVTPYSKLNNRITALAWGWIDEMDEFDRNRLLRFYEARVDKGRSRCPRP